MKDYDSEDVIVAIAGIYLASYVDRFVLVFAFRAIINQPKYVDIFILGIFVDQNVSEYRDGEKMYDGTEDHGRS